MTSKKSKLVTAAIDFGTTFSGYAYAFKCDLEKEPPTIHNYVWPAGQLRSHKAPTCVLFSPDRTENYFGYKAEEKYAQLCEDDQHQSYYFFQQFKMMLHSSKMLSKTTTLTEEGGKSMLALDVFAAAINFMKEHLLETIHKKIASITNKDVHWVLTVPAIWEDSAKQFMREAAGKAGIQHEQLSIVLEPECASVYCQRIPIEKQMYPDGAKLQIIEPHSKFMVIDLGGGTADITVHEREADGTLKELHKASGEAWGGTKVDREFIGLLKNIFGGECVGSKIWGTFKEKNMEDYIELLREFELKKRDGNIEGGGRVTIKLPASLLEIFEEKTEKTLKQVIGKTKFGDKITPAGDKMRLQSSVIKSLFAPAVDSIVNHLKELFKLEGVSSIDTLLMVGGFSGSCHVQDAIQKEFPAKRLYIPGEPDLAVLMGAVLFGNNPDVISFRMSKFTYGISTKDKFKPGEHCEDRKRVIDGENYCIDCFTKLVEVNQRLKVGEEVVKRSVYPTSKNDTYVSVMIFAAVEKSPKYVTDTGCQRLGSIEVGMPDLEGGTGREIEVKMNFSGTEFEVEALEMTTMKTYKTRVNFLN